MGREEVHSQRQLEQSSDVPAGEGDDHAGLHEPARGDPRLQVLLRRDEVCVPRHRASGARRHLRDAQQHVQQERLCSHDFPRQTKSARNPNQPHSHLCSGGTEFTGRKNACCPTHWKEA